MMGLRTVRVVTVANPGFEGEPTPTSGLTKDEVSTMFGSFFDKIRTELVVPLQTQFSDLQKKIVPPPAPPAPSGNFDPNDPAYKELPPAILQSMKLLHESNAALTVNAAEEKKSREEAQRQVEQSNLNSAITSALSAITTGEGPKFVSSEAQKVAADLLKLRVKKNEADGTYVGADNLPLESSAKDFLTKSHAYLFKASGQSGAGAGPGGQPGGGGTSNIGMDDIKFGMTLDEQAAVGKEILRHVPRAA